MKSTKLFAVICVALLVLVAFPVVAQDTSLTTNEALVMKWIEASANPDIAGAVAKDVLAPNFVYYCYNNSRVYDAAYFINMDKGANYLPNAVGCVVKSEHDLVEATYGLIQPYGMQLMQRTILFRVENGKIAEAWFGHTL